MITLQTSRFGTITINPAECLQFASPILGFETYRQFVILEHEPDSPFQWLQSTQDGNLAFVVTNPGLFFNDYSFTLPEEYQEQLQVEKADELITYTLVTVPNEDPSQMTTNLLAPIVINTSNHKAVQAVLHHSPHKTRVPLITPATTAEGDNTPC